MSGSVVCTRACPASAGGPSATLSGAIRAPLALRPVTSRRNSFGCDPEQGAQSVPRHGSRRQRRGTVIPPGQQAQRFPAGDGPGARASAIRSAFEQRRESTAALEPRRSLILGDEHQRSMERAGNARNVPNLHIIRTDDVPRFRIIQRQRKDQMLRCWKARGHQPSWRSQSPSPP
jgi:hypothetical protein